MSFKRDRFDLVNWWGGYIQYLGKVFESESPIKCEKLFYLGSLNDVNKVQKNCLYTCLLWCLKEKIFQTT